MSGLVDDAQHLELAVIAPYYNAAQPRAPSIVMTTGDSIGLTQASTGQGVMPRVQFY